ncbi:MAG: DUF4147 domain-containing protein [Cuniculiplasma sp.]
MTDALKNVDIAIREAVRNNILKESPSNIVSKYNREMIDFVSGNSFSILAIGKASIPMFKGLDKWLVGHSTLRVCLSPDPEPMSEVTVLKGNHPFPSFDTFDSTEKIMELIRNDRSDSLIFLLSGGTSSLFEKPRQSISRDEYLEIMHKLVNGGFPIEQINSVRCQLSDVKCGKMINHSSYGSILILAISDVPGDDISVIGSNPFFPSVNRDQEISLLEKFHIQFEKTIIRDCNVSGKIILKGEKYARDLMDSIELGIEKIYLGNILKGDVNICAEKITEFLRKEYDRLGKPFLFSASGETTSRVIGNGKGGRNCLLSALILQKMDENEIFTFLSLATDGEDGNSGLAGFIVDSALKKSVIREEINRYVENSDTGTLAIKLKRHIFTGPTGNNVSDVVIGYYGGVIQ